MRSFFVPIILLIIWVFGAEYIWICKVKHECGSQEKGELVEHGGSMDTDTSSVPGSQSIAAGNIAAGNTDGELSEKQIHSGSTQHESLDEALTDTTEGEVVQYGVEGDTSTLQLQTLAEGLPTLALADHEGAALVASDVGLGFSPTVAQGSLSSEQDQFFKQVAQYCKNNPEKKLQIIGSYSLEESTPQAVAAHDKGVAEDAQSMGLLRAQWVSDKLLGLGVTEGQMQLQDQVVDQSMPFYPVAFKLAPELSVERVGAELQANQATIDKMNMDQGSKGEMLSTAMTADTAQPSMPALVLTGSNQEVQYQSQQGFGFTANSSKVDPSAKDHQVFDNLVQNIQEESSSAVQVIGHYASHERNDSNLPNLGLARAAEVGNILETKGLASDKIIKSFRQVDRSETGYYGVELQLASLQTPDADMSEDQLLEELSEAVHVYFGFNSDDILLSDEQRARITNMIQYLNRTSSYELMAVGHTDSQGDAKQNTLLGAARAQRVKDYVVAFGVDGQRITVSSQGEQFPVATNATAEGRQLNRRVELVLNKIN